MKLPHCLPITFFRAVFTDHYPNGVFQSVLSCITTLLWSIRVFFKYYQQNLNSVKANYDALCINVNTT